MLSYDRGKWASLVSRKWTAHQSPKDMCPHTRSHSCLPKRERGTKHPGALKSANAESRGTEPTHPPFPQQCLSPVCVHPCRLRHLMVLVQGTHRGCCRAHSCGGGGRGCSRTYLVHVQVQGVVVVHAVPFELQLVVQDIVDGVQNLALEFYLHYHGGLACSTEISSGSQV